MSTQGKRAALVVALLVAVIGLVVGLWPHSVPAGTGSLSCGSAFAPSSQDSGKAAAEKNLQAALRGQQSDFSGTQTDLLAQCDDAVSGPRTFAFVLIGLGVVAAIGVSLARTPQPRAV